MDNNSFEKADKLIKETYRKAKLTNLERRRAKFRLFCNDINTMILNSNSMTL